AAHNEPHPSPRLPTLLNCLGLPSRSPHAVALAGEVHGSVPRVETRSIRANEFDRRGTIADEAVEIVGVLGLCWPAEPRADWIDEYEIGRIEPRRLIVLER